MKKMLTTGCALFAVAALAAPFAAATKPSGDHGHGHGNGGSSDIAKQCHAAKKADKAAFRALYGKHAMRKCIHAGDPPKPKALKGAAKACRAERAADPDAFAVKYGTNHNHRNAFGKCVSKKLG